MDHQYEQEAMREMHAWQHEMQRKPNIADRLSGDFQRRINKIVPEKVHRVITVAFREMVRTVLTGAAFVNEKPLAHETLRVRELLVRDKINAFRNTAAAEGAITGAGGILLGLADFPIWLSLKMKMLASIASLYGYDIRDLKERVYLLYIFQLTFSSKQNRRKVYHIMADWENHARGLPDNTDSFDWRTFQQEYRDYIDLAKLLQLIPGIGAVVGAYVNHRLTDKLGKTAMNAYRMRRQRITSS